MKEVAQRFAAKNLALENLGPFAYLFAQHFRKGLLLSATQKRFMPNASLLGGHPQEVQILCNFREGKYISRWSLLDLLRHEVLSFSSHFSVAMFFFHPFDFHLRQRSLLKSDPFVRRPKEVASVTAQWPHPLDIGPRSLHWSSTGRSNTLINGTGWGPRVPGLALV